MTGDLAVVIGRLSTLTSVIRTRSLEATRADLNGGTADEIRARIAVVVEQLERVADQLEETLAA